MPSSAVGKPLIIEADPRVPAPDYDNAPCGDLDPKAADAQFHPKRMGDEDTLAAKALCKRCPQATDCLLYVLANSSLFPEGVWAATTPKERDELRARLTERLGDDWVAAAVRTRTRARRRRPPARRHGAAQSSLVEAA